MPKSVLHLLAQRPAATGSGITLEALVLGADVAGWKQSVVCGVPADAPAPRVGNLQASQVHPLLFQTGKLDFPVPGMSDVMPYRSTRFSSLDAKGWSTYRQAWREHLERVLEQFRPDVIHAHHLWLLSALVKDVAPNTPLVIHSHATGLRQMELCPDHAQEVREGCARADHFCVLHSEHQRSVATALGVPKERITIVGAGYREELFHGRRRPSDTGRTLLYVGKLSAAKGVGELARAFALISKRIPGARLHVVGSGAGAEGEWIGRELAALGDAVVLHGRLDQGALAEIMRQSSVCVLPSYYEGLPLVLVEAAASGCALVSTELSGVVNELAPHLGARLRLVPLPRLEGVDRPVREALPAFVNELARVLEAALTSPIPALEQNSLEQFTWRAVFERVEKIWMRVTNQT